MKLFHIVGSCDQTWSSGEGHEDQDPGGNLSVFSANQGTKIDKSNSRFYFLWTFYGSWSEQYFWTCFSYLFF